MCAPYLMRRWPALILLACGAALAALAAHALFGLGGSASDTFFNAWVYDGLILASALLCLARGMLAREDRAGWIVLGIGLVSYFGGELYWSLQIDGSPPFPSPADALYLGFYPAAYVALVLFARHRMRGFQRSLWLDGVVAGLAVAAIGATFVLQPVMDATGGSVSAVATTLAYPLGDILLLAFVLALLTLNGWRWGPFMLLAAGFAVSAVADSIYLVQASKEAYVEGTILDAVWPLGTLLMGAAAWLRPPRRSADMHLDGWRMLAVPAAASVAVLALLVYDGSADMGITARLLTYAALLAIFARAALAFGENIRLLAASRHEALSDALTGLANRRHLMADLDDDMSAVEHGESRLLMLFDLDGFKQYNDNFGHPAGDALLARLGRELADAIRPYGTAYRMGGDEFCVIVRDAAHQDEAAVEAASALAETGEGFQITSSFGTVRLGVDAAEAPAALQLADRRMYAQKDERRASARRQARDVLLKMLQERQPLLGEHAGVVVERATRLGRAMKLDPEELDVLARASELHDIGKIAIPDAILEKPGPLDADELAFMRRHPAIGDRILSAAPALQPVARVVRASHERFDGSGYPDGLRGEKIPLGGRIIAVCDAFAAMTSDRPWRAPMSEQDAMARLRREAGNRFDPAVVEAFEACQLDLSSELGRSTARAEAP
jgi:two-component system cell cycle response regulator